MAKTITNGGKSGDIDGTDHGDVINGMGGDDEIYGGHGHDILTGGPGNDTFVFTEFGKGDSDHITDFKHGDKIGIDPTVFTAFKNGHFMSGEFYIGPMSLDSDDYLNYDPTTGHLYYDDDATGPDKQHLLATFDHKPMLHAHDFVLVHEHSMM